MLLNKQCDINWLILLRDISGKEKVLSNEKDVCHASLKRIQIHLGPPLDSTKQAESQQNSYSHVLYIHVKVSLFILKKEPFNSTISDTYKTKSVAVRTSSINDMRKNKYVTVKTHLYKNWCGF